MPTNSFLQEYRTRLEDLLWSLWSELGARGWERRHRDWWIDPEALILFTATLDPIDPRLRDEAIDWCLRHQRYLSTSRARNLLQKYQPNASSYQPQLGRFLATAAMAMGRFSDQEEEPQPYPFQPREHSCAQHLTRGAMLSARLRALLGVTARAEIVRVFLARPGATFTAFDLVNEDAGYTKRAIRDALEDLREGGFVELAETGNRNGYSFLATKSFYGLLDLPLLRFPAWRPLFAVLRGLLDLIQRLEQYRPATKPIEARRALSALREEVRSAGLLMPSTVAGSDVVSELRGWTVGLIDSLASGSTDMPGVWAIDLGSGRTYRD